MKKAIALIVLTLVLLTITGCATTALKKAHREYVENMGPPLLRYSEADPTLPKETLEARQKLHQAALNLIAEGE